MSGWFDLGSLLVIIALNIVTIIFVHPQIRIVFYSIYFLHYIFIILAMISSVFERQVDIRKMGSKIHHFVPASPIINLTYIGYTFPFTIILFLFSSEEFIDSMIALIFFVLWTVSEILAFFAYLVYSENISIYDTKKEEVRIERKKFKQSIKMEKKYARIDAERMEGWKTKIQDI